MKLNIEVTDKHEADAIRRALQDPATRALVIVVGVLLALPEDEARSLVIRYVEQHGELQ